MSTTMIVVVSGLSGVFIGIGLIVGVAFLAVKKKQKDVKNKPYVKKK